MHKSENIRKRGRNIGRKASRMQPEVFAILYGVVATIIYGGRQLERKESYCAGGNSNNESKWGKGSNNIRGRCGPKSKRKQSKYSAS